MQSRRPGKNARCASHQISVASASPRAPGDPTGTVQARGLLRPHGEEGQTASRRTVSPRGSPCQGPAPPAHNEARNSAFSYRVGKAAPSSASMGGADHLPNPASPSYLDLRPRPPRNRRCHSASRPRRRCRHRAHGLGRTGAAAGANPASLPRPRSARTRRARGGPDLEHGQIARSISTSSAFASLSPPAHPLGWCSGGGGNAPLQASPGRRSSARSRPSPRRGPGRSSRRHGVTSPSKQRRTCRIASTSRMLPRNWLPSPLPLAGALDEAGDVDELQLGRDHLGPTGRSPPAFPAAGRARRPGRHSARSCRTGSSPPRPLGSRSEALNRVDLPTFGRPTMPQLKPIGDPVSKRGAGGGKRAAGPAGRARRVYGGPAAAEEKSGPANRRRGRLATKTVGGETASPSTRGTDRPGDRPPRGADGAG